MENKPEFKELKPYSFDWWWEKGYQDCSEFLEPKHPKVKPYLEGWLCKEDEYRETWGDVDFINQ
jgi:hypothetical protein